MVVGEEEPGVSPDRDGTERAFGIVLEAESAVIEETLQGIAVVTSGQGIAASSSRPRRQALGLWAAVVWRSRCEAVSFFSFSCSCPHLPTNLFEADL